MTILTLRETFKANSAEVIMQFYTNRLSSPAITRFFLPAETTRAPNFVEAGHLLNAFESGCTWW